MADQLKECVVVAGTRTATGNFLGTIKDIKAFDMGAVCISKIMAETGVPGEAIDEVIMGNQFQAGNQANPSRWAARYGGLPDSVPAFTPMKNCGTGLKAIVLGAQSIQTGDNEVMIAGGMESMSGCPYYLMDARQGMRMGHGKTVRDGLFEDGLLDPVVQGHMGLTAENLAEKYKITREEQDEYALECHQKAEAAWAAGKFDADIVPLEVPQRRGDPKVFNHDETYRKGLKMEDLVKLKPAFLKGGTVTPGNASPLNDGAAAVMLMTAEKAKEYGLKPLLRYVGSASAGYDPKLMGYTPVLAVRKLLKKTGLTLNDIGLIESNEAFAVQAMTVARELGFDPKKVNVNGGAIALGHPTGCTGARLTVTIGSEMRRRGVKYGLVTLCIGGGQGIAAIYELCE